jgi:hypothetical protein
MYFGPDEEEAVVRFIESDSERERNAIYNQWLRKPLDKMIESIIRRYKLYRKGFSFEDLHADTLSFLITKSDKFDKEANKRAYSYYGTICRNYVLGLIIKDESVLKQIASYEDIDPTYFEDREDLSYTHESDALDLQKLIKKISESIQLEIENNHNLPPKKQLDENEIKVGYALIEILENWELILDIENSGSKFNKNSVLETMRNYTNLTTKDIRVAMKKYKKIYGILKLDTIENGD